MCIFRYIISCDYLDYEELRIQIMKHPHKLYKLLTLNSNLIFIF